MEEPNPAQTNPTPPPNTPQNLPPPPPQPPTSLPQKTKKRSLDSNVSIQNSKYFKTRAVVKDLRPHFIEVLRSPDFRNCKAANEIREQLKVLMDLYKQMTAETVSIGKCKNVPEAQPTLSENKDGQKPHERHQDVKQAEQSVPDRAFAKPSEDMPFPTANLSEKQRPEDGWAQGTYVVGGSAFGWNFITFPGSKPAYYGVTKETFRAAAK
ncbi:uncharacterized protein LOC117931630 [Vitis riparia]|uniref:uncharacterized protein LOC117931630 n=1 Tax=Vitis riparia TaxID=96939 RepID=UPI00155B07E7|nr:uncharacterized protein LOC117931630 [Vitis riparia]